MTEKLLSVSELSVANAARPGDAPILDHVSFDVAPGEALAIIGRSGAGKSVLGRALMGWTEAPLTVTADFHVRLHRPTPVESEIIVRAHAAEVAAPKVVVEATIEAGGKVTASCRGTFVRVLEGHPAFVDWG